MCDHTWHRKIARRRTAKPRWRQTGPVCACIWAAIERFVPRLQRLPLKRSPPSLSLSPLSAHMYLLTAASLSRSLSQLLSLSSFPSQLLLKCPFRIPMCCSLLGNSENREAGRLQRGRGLSFLFFCKSIYLFLMMLALLSR